MTKPNFAKCESGDKTNTRRCNKQWLKIKKGHWMYFRSDYKTTYETASGPYLATEDARLEMARDITDGDVAAEGCECYVAGFGDSWESAFADAEKRRP